MTGGAATPSALVVGAGSIGRRHARNLALLGCRVSACDRDPARMEELPPEVRRFGSLDEALAGRPELVAVCTPPASHVAIARRAVGCGAHVFVEKPVSHSEEGLDELEEEARRAGRVVQVGYNLRFHPGLRSLRAEMCAGAIGRVLWAHVEFGQYLPDWRPWQDYRQSYTARAALGGGIILDGSHEIDYALWLFGEPRTVTCMAGRAGTLEVDVEDSVTILMEFAGGTRVDVHLDFLQRHYTRACRLVGELGTMEWDYPAARLRLRRADQAEWDERPVPFEPNEMYLAEMESFLAAARTGAAPAVSLADARRTLNVALAAREAAANRRWIDV